MKVMGSAVSIIRQETRGRESWEGYYPIVFNTTSLRLCHLGQRPEGNE